MHVGPPVDLEELHPGRPRDAMRAQAKIMLAIIAGLVPLRADQPGAPHYGDPTRPLGPSQPVASSAVSLNRPAAR